jgi:DNA-binding MarR family transcriptional regulator
MRGIGKTTLVRELAGNLATKLDFVVWISLETAPPLIDVLETVVKELGGSRKAKLSRNLPTAIDKTISYLQTNRCLLVFDNADLGLNQSEQSNVDLVSDYTQFFDQLNTLDSNVCCLILAAEKPANINPSYRQLELRGLDRSSCQSLLDTSELVGSITEWDRLVDRYQGNPQYLKIVANTIADIFAGKIEKFLSANILIYGQIETLLSQQLDLLSNAEMSILLWLAIERQPISLDRLQLLTSVSIDDTATVKILDKLVRKYLVEVRDDLFTLSELIMESITARYQDLVCTEITTKKLKILHLHPILPSKIKSNLHNDWTRETLSQPIKHLLLPIVARLITREHSTPPRSGILSAILFPSAHQRAVIKQDLIDRLRDILSQLDPVDDRDNYYPRTQLFRGDTSYAVENITHLLAAIEIKSRS